MMTLFDTNRYLFIFFLFFDIQLRTFKWTAWWQGLLTKVFIIYKIKKCSSPANFFWLASLWLHVFWQYTLQKGPSQSGRQVCFHFGIFTLGGGQVALIFFIVIDFIFVCIFFCVVRVKHLCHRLKLLRKIMVEGLTLPPQLK